MSHVTHISEKERKKESESCHRYEWANIWYISHQIPLGNASRYVFISMYETALYFHKRALNSRKRALHFHTRAIHCPSNTSGQWVTLHLHFYVWKRWKSSIFPQKSPRFPQKSPSFPQKSHKISTREPYSACQVLICIYERALYFRKRALYFRKRALAFHKRALDFRNRTLHNMLSLNLYVWKSAIFYKTALDSRQRALDFCKRTLHHMLLTFSSHTLLRKWVSLESYHEYEWDMSRTWMSHVPHMNESCHTYEWVMSHIWMSHVTHMKKSCHADESPLPSITSGQWVMSHIRLRHVTLMNEPCHTYDSWDMSHIWMSHVTRMNESCHAYEWVMSRRWVTFAINHLWACKDKIVGESVSMFKSWFRLVCLGSVGERKEKKNRKEKQKTWTDFLV